MCAIRIDHPRIVSPRLSLRALAGSDVSRLTRLIDDIGVAGMTTRIPHPYGRADALAFFSAERDKGSWSLAVNHPDDGFIGVVALDRKSGPLPELGYWLGRPYWGRGYATEAVGALLQWARDARDLRAVTAGHFDDNPASARVLDKAGFYTGVVEPRFSTARGATCRTRMMVWLA